jgi:hypothetical protein
MTKTIELDYWLRWQFEGYHDRLQRWAVLVCHPRAASVRFAAALCEISGNFLIFTPARRASGTTLNGLRLSLGSVASTPLVPQPLRGHGSP